MNGTLNKVMLIGHLGDDVKMHYFDGGNCIGRFQLATNEVYINKINNLPVRTKKSMRGVLSKGGYEVPGMITYRQEQTFSNYKVNDKAFPNLDEFKIPADYTPEKDDAGKPLLAIGTDAPEWSLVNTAGKSLSSKELKGKIILIDFTSTT